MKVGGRMLVAALVVAGLFAPASANAAVSATITGDDGQPVPMTVGAPPTIRNMNVSVAPALGAGGRGVVAASWSPTRRERRSRPTSCWRLARRRRTASVPLPRQHARTALTVTLFNAASCAGALEGRSHRVHLERRGERRDRSARRPAADARRRLARQQHPPARLRRQPGRLDATRSSTPRAA